jgi:CheY-like chemotaxis protein
MEDVSRERAMILAIDDEPSILADLEQALRAAGYGFCGCASAEAALATALRTVPDLILSDINLGEQNGLELCEELKEHAMLTDVPVIFLSGAPIPDVIRRAHAVGGTYYVRKPFDPEVLIDLVEKALWMPHLIARRATAAC